MKNKVCAAILVMFCCGVAAAQDQTVTPAPAGTPTRQQQQQNAASATKDTSGTTGDQITKPEGAKGSALTGCLSGPDKDGKYSLHNMSYREGVQVLGGDDLQNDAGAKVKLTGKWETPSQENGSTQKRRFQVTDVEVLSKTCSSPSETVPVSKNKKQKATTYDAPGTPK